MRAWIRLKVLWTVVAIVAGCAMSDSRRPYFHDDRRDPPEFSAQRLGEPSEGSSVADHLTDDEREAFLRSGMADDLRLSERADGDAGLADEDPLAQQTGWDKAAGVSLTLLGVGMTVGAMVAPYLLF